MEKPERIVSLRLKSVDVLQTLDALDSRATAYERTAKFLDGAISTEDPCEDPFVIEEVEDSDEAREIARHFRDVEAELSRQLGAWQKANQ